MWECKHCKQKFDYIRATDKANHSRHCNCNPKKGESYKALAIAQYKFLDSRDGKLKNFDVECGKCKKLFSVEEREYRFPTKENYYCSLTCAHSIGGIAKAKKHHPDEIASYQTVAWRHHEKKCIVCGEENIVTVHHVNNMHSDNDPKNLVPLCPTHHQYCHSKFKYLVNDFIEEYVKNKWKDI